MNKQSFINWVGAKPVISPDTFTKIIQERTEPYLHGAIVPEYINTLTIAFVKIYDNLPENSDTKNNFPKLSSLFTLCCILSDEIIKDELYCSAISYPTSDRFNFSSDILDVIFDLSTKNVTKMFDAWGVSYCNKYTPDIIGIIASNYYYITRQISPNHPNFFDVVLNCIENVNDLGGKKLSNVQIITEIRKTIRQNK